ncbi:MAG: 16S rRNA (cytidine(1402)-2'-O)-methyltransferase [Candidatus Lightella neohaematopini]|nr:16S rRNA (cytidine(1402)-2'-O)-methyltransferase [Candidatus Lightella neohaematopini]
MSNSKSILYIVPTPIGNLLDITNRAIHTLSNVDYIITENIQHTCFLLNYFSIRKCHLYLLNQYNEYKQVNYLLTVLKKNKTMALVSNAGTPLISDPGYKLVYECKKLNIHVIPLPGPCAAITALSASGLPANKFCYEGFLSSKRKKRIKQLKLLLYEPRTIIIYESTHRLIELLEDIVQVFNDNRYIVLAKELTKIWENIYGAPVNKLIHHIKNSNLNIKGEITLIIQGYSGSKNINYIKALEIFIKLKKLLPLNVSLSIVKSIFKIKRNILYKNFINFNKNK